MDDAKSLKLDDVNQVENYLFGVLQTFYKYNITISNFFKDFFINIYLRKQS